MPTTPSIFCKIVDFKPAECLHVRLNLCAVSAAVSSVASELSGQQMNGSLNEKALRNKRECL